MSLNIKLHEILTELADVPEDVTAPRSYTVRLKLTAGMWRKIIATAQAAKIQANVTAAVTYYLTACKPAGVGGEAGPTLGQVVEAVGRAVEHVRREHLDEITARLSREILAAVKRELAQPPPKK